MGPIYRVNSLEGISNGAMKLSTEIFYLLPYQVKNNLFSLACALAHQFLLYYCCYIHAVVFLFFFQFGPHSDKAEISTAPGPPDQCCKPVISCKSATSVIVSWEVSFNVFQQYTNEYLAFRIIVMCNIQKWKKWQRYGCNILNISL